MSTQIKVILADDHQMFLDGITTLLNRSRKIEILGTAGSGEELLQLLKSNTPDIVITDLQMTGMSGVEAAEKIKTRYPNIKIIALTMHNEEGFVRKLVEHGVSGYVLKNAGREELMAAIEKVNSGNSFFSPEVMQTMMDSVNKPKPKKSDDLPLSIREKQIISLICKEYTTNDIAERLKLSPLTIETHRKNIFLKLGVKNIAGLVRFAIKHGLDE
jgi:DNA-binding NarL/FixJ family response regulator